MSNRLKFLFGIVIAYIIIMFIGAAVVVKIDEYGIKKQINESTKLVATLHKGEHLAYQCDESTYFVILFKTTPNSVGVLKGYTYEIREYTFSTQDEEPDYALAGCKVMKIVNDPFSNYMLEIYERP